MEIVVDSRWLPTLKSPSLLLGFKRVSQSTVLIACVLSLFALIYVKEQDRRLAAQYQQAKKEYRHLINEKNGLLLEEAVWSNQSHVQRMAQRRLKMYAPKKPVHALV